MGDRLTESQTSRTPYGDIFDAYLPHYLAIGMPYDLFWDGEYGARKAFLKAYQIRMENEERMMDISHWNMGLYLREALRSVELAAVAVPVKKISGLESYPERPHVIQKEEEERERKKAEKTAEAEEARRKKEEDQSKLAMAVFQQAVARMNGNIIRRLERDKQKEGSGQ